MLNNNEITGPEGGEFENQSEKQFDKLGLDAKLCDEVAKVGFTEPTSVQEKVIPLLLQGKDLIAQAQTGSGKTASFVLPAIQGLKYDKSVEVLVLVPTRELASQVSKEFLRFGKELNVRVTNVVGGEAIYRQVELINRGSEVVVATPGRILDHLKSKRLKRFNPSLLILDEADEMLDMGFFDDVKKIISYLPEKRQNAMFSATMPSAIEKLAYESMENPSHIVVEGAGQHNADIEQFLCVLSDEERLEGLSRIIEFENPEKVIVFCRTRRDTDCVSENLNRRGFRAAAIHGEHQQSARNRAIEAMRKGAYSVLVATDIAARGLDIPEVSHVINFQIPDNKERHTHRIGRTGRAGRKGKAITLVNQREFIRSDFFKMYPRDHFQYMKVPTYKSLQVRKTQSLWEKILQAGTDADAKDAVRVLSDTIPMDEVAAKLYSMLSDSINAGKKTGSPSQAESANEIGLSVEEIVSINLKAKKTRKSRGPLGRGAQGRGAPQRRKRHIRAIGNSKSRKKRSGGAN